MLWAMPAHRITTKNQTSGHWNNMQNPQFTIGFICTLAARSKDMDTVETMAVVKICRVKQYEVQHVLRQWTV